MSDLTGQYIDHYHILEPLGQGGMANVYKAYDTRLEREVAIKFIRRDAFPPEMLERMLQRFEREAKALARLSHPNIVAIHDYGEYQGSPYLVMQYVPSGTLKHLVGTPMPYSQAARMLLPIARALEYAHRHHIIHRDVKPANILITESGGVLLSDFGISKILEGDDGGTLTGTGVSIGTPEYMAPEQVLAKDADARSDIYSLGVIFYELVTGQKPYSADTPMAVLIKHINDPLPQPRQFIPDLPEQAEFVIIKALAKNPNERYSGMAEFADELEKLATGQLPDNQREVSPARPQSANSDRLHIQQAEEEKTIEHQKPPVRKPGIIPGWVWGVLGLVIIVLLIIGIGALWNNVFSPSKPTATQIAALPIETPTLMNVPEFPTKAQTDIPANTPTSAIVETPKSTIKFSGTLRIWADDTRAPILQNLAGRVKESYGVDLIVESKSSIRDNFQTAASAGESPDIIIISHDQAGTLISNGLLAPVDLGAKADLFVQLAKDACTFNGVLYCMPFATENIGFFYNTDLVSVPPTTWDEVVSIGEVLKAEGKVKYIMALSGTTYDLYPLFTSFGGYIFGKDANGAWNPQDLGVDSEGMIAAAIWLQDNIDKGNLPTDTDWANNHSLFETGKVPFIMAGPWALDRIRQSGIRYAVTNFPSDGFPFAGTIGLFISSQSQNKLLAQIFLTEFMATDESMQRLYEVTKRPPAYIPVLNKINDADLKAMAIAGEKATMMPAIPALNFVWRPWSDAIALIIQGKQEPEAALKDAGTKIRDLISGN